MIKKLLFLLIVLLVLSGCEAVYNLEIDDVYNESVVITPTTETEMSKFSRSFNEMFYTAHLADDYDPEEEPPKGVAYYEKMISDGNVLTFKHKFTKDNFGDSRLANLCFPSFLFIEGKHLRFNTLADFDCYTDYPGLENVTININVKGEVYNHNADSVNGTVYTWVIKPGQLRALNLEYENPDTKEEKKKDNSNKDTEGNQNNQNNKENNNNDNNQNNTEKKKKHTFSNTTIYLLTGLFFAFLFGIIIFTSKYKK